MNRTELQELADVRISEAQAHMSLSPSFPDGAYYLAGYAVECALKAAIAKLYNQHDWPEKEFVNRCHTHKILELVILARLEADRQADIAADRVFQQNWDIIKDWSEQSRYQRHSLAKAQNMIEAITNPTNGVLHGSRPATSRADECRRETGQRIRQKHTAQRRILAQRT